MRAGVTEDLQPFLILSVISVKAASRSISVEVSTNAPSSLPASAALASLGLMCAAASATLTDDQTDAPRHPVNAPQTFYSPDQAKKIRPLGRKSRKSVGRLDWTRTNDPHHVKVVL